MSIVNLSHEYQVEIDKVGKNEWENLLPHFDDATIYQTWSYGAVRWGEKYISHLVLKKDNQVVGLAQSTIMKAPFIRAGIAYIPWGPLWQKKEGENNFEHFQHLMKALKDEYALRRGLLLRINSHYVENEGDNDICSILKGEGFKKDASSSRYRTFLVDISHTLPEIRKKLDQKWRNQLNRSEKNSLTIVEGNSDELYQIFLNLQNEMLERKRYEPGVDYGEFKEIQKDLPEHLKMRVIICEYEGEPVTATIGSAIGNTGIYLLGATGDKGLQLKGAYLTQWLMIRWMKEQSCHWYDLGGINPEKNPGVYHFKAGLSGTDKSHIGQFELCQNILSSQFVFLSNRLKNIIGRIKHL
jgi:lipid II:glycine glycyltransferase (peptidoglycan interpeptide bridge formation enzyme)